MKETSFNQTKTVLITGGAKRIGAALVKAFHLQGMNVLFQYHNSANKAEKLIQALNQQRQQSAIAVCCDLEIFENYQLLCDEVGRHFGRLDVLINNASAFFPTPMNQANEEQWNRLLNVNAKAPFFLSQCCKPMLEEHQGAIINLTDIYADIPLAEHAIYSASKAALANITRSMAADFAPNIRVNAIAPGAILAAEGKNNDCMAQLIAKTPLKRLGGESAIVDTALFLANQAGFITGQTIKVDGGRSIV